MKKICKMLFVFVLIILACTRVFAIDRIELSTIPIKEGDMLTLEECINIALQRSPAIKNYRYNYEMAKHNVSIAKGEYSPTISAGAGYAHGFNSNKRRLGSYTRTLPSVDARLQQLIWNFGRTSANIRMEKFYKIAAEYDFYQEVIDTIFDVKCKYYAVLAAKAIVDIDKANVQINERNYQRTKAYFEEGIKSKIDLVNAEVYLSDSKITLVQAENDYKNAIVSLNNAMYVAFAPQYSIKNTETFNFKYDYLPVSLVKITDYKDISDLPDAVYNATFTTQVEKTEILKDYVFKKFPYSFDEAIKLAYENRWDLKALEATKNALKQYLLYVKREYYPELSGSVGYGFVNRELYSNNSFDIAVEISSALNPFQTKHKIDNAKIQVEMAQNDIEELKQNMFFDIQKAYIDMITYEKQIPLNEIKVRQTLENLELADGRYEVGLGDFIEVQDAKVNYNNAQNTYIQTIYDYNVSRATLEREISLQENTIKLEDKANAEFRRNKRKNKNN
ncbi:MAG: TolC family protein [Candidatus Gastranaerophilales bacterium]|nr:TolC family protein [Candidatus Gastranaerophilales bacterium]